MNKVLMGLIFFLMIITVQQVQGCSLALPTNNHIVNIRGTEDPNRYLVTIQNTKYESKDAILDLDKQKLTDVTLGDQELISTFGTPTDIVYTDIITQEGRSVNWVILQNSSIVLNATFDVPTNSIVSNWSFISDSLNIAYLLYFTENNTGHLYLISTESSQVIYSEDYNEYYLPSFTIYDEEKLLVAYLGGGDCRKALYLTYDATGFHEIQTTYSWQSNFFDTREQRLITSEFRWESELTEITIINYDSGSEYSFNLTSAELSLDSETALTDTLDFPLPLLLSGLTFLGLPFARKFRNLS